MFRERLVYRPLKRGIIFEQPFVFNSERRRNAGGVQLACSKVWICRTLANFDQAGHVWIGENVNPAESHQLTLVLMRAEGTRRGAPRASGLRWPNGTPAEPYWQPSSGGWLLDPRDPRQLASNVIRSMFVGDLDVPDTGAPQRFLLDRITSRSRALIVAGA